MTEVLWVVVGILIGGSILGIAVFFYILFTALRTATNEIRELKDVIAPIFSDQDIMRSLKTIQILNVQGEQVGRKIESLDNTMQAFSRVLLKPSEPTYSPVELAAAARAVAESGATAAPAPDQPGTAYGYGEEEAASREEARIHERERGAKERADALF